MTSFISTGSLGIDGMLGGGWQKGAIVELWGGPGTGKTTLGQHAVNDLEPPAEALWMCVGSELPHREIRASVVSAKTAEMAFTIMEAALSTRAKLIIVDSANGLIRSREIEGSPDYDWWYKPHSQREYKPELDKLQAQCEFYGATVLFLSKPRTNERPPIRGTGISEVAKQRVTLKTLATHQDGSSRVEASLKTREWCEIVMHPGTGLDWAEELLRIAVEHGIVSKRGAWYTMPDAHQVQGAFDAIRYIREYPALSAYLSREIRKDFQIE